VKRRRNATDVPELYDDSRRSLKEKSMSHRHFFTAALIAAGATIAALPSAAFAQQKQVWKASDVHPLGYPTVEAIQRMGKKFEAQTNGRISIQMFPAMQLGGEKEMIEQAQVGALQIARISVGAMGPVVDDLNVFNLPFVFRDEAHMRKVIDGPIGQELLDRVSNAPTSRLIVLGWMDAGTRNVYANKRAAKPADLKGMKIRMMGNPLFVETMNSMGGNGVAMGFNELYSALQTGVVDGAENNPPTLLAQNHFQVSKIYSLTGHLIIPEIFVFSKRTWDALSKDDQTLLRKLSREAQMEQRQLWDTYVTDAETKLKAAGIQFVNADKDAFYKATQPIRDKYGSKYAALLKRIQDTK
jgi:tripartite ATP-independent transporter DctP family solute receptor